MEEEDLFYDDFFKSIGNTESVYTAPGVKTYGYNSTLGKSQYDKKLMPNIELEETDFFNSLSSYRASEQSGLDQFGNSLVRLVNIIPEAVGGIASALDFEDYVNSDNEVGNWLTSMMDEIKETTTENFPIYRESPGKPLDFGDSGWWFENGSSLVNSIGGFAISGGIISKSLQGLSKISKINKLAQMIAGGKTAEKVGNITNTVVNATMLNQAESIMEATDVYDTTYQFELDKQNAINDPSIEGQEEINIEIAKQMAAEAAEITIATNRANILLNLSSANLFLKSPRSLSKILKKETFKRSATTAAIEGGQESVEEIINLIAGERGRAFGKNQDYDLASVIKNLSIPEAAEAALLGFIGGMGQTIITKEGVNRLQKVIDPETGQNISVRDYNKKKYEQQKEELDKLDSYANEKDVKSFTSVFNSIFDNIELQKAYKEAQKNEDYTEADRISKLILGVQSFNAFNNGTTDRLIKLYQELKDGPQKEGMEDDYKEKADLAISNIKKLRKYYNFAQDYANPKEVYLNRSVDVDLNNELESLNKDLTEKSSDLTNKINLKLQTKKYSNLKFHPDKMPHITDMSFTPDEIYSNNVTDKLSEAFKNEIKKLPEFKNYSDIKGAIDNINSLVENNDTEYNNITSKKYQKEYNKKKEPEQINKKVEEAINSKQDEIETEIKKDEVEEIKKVEEEVQVLAEEKQKVESESEEINDSIFEDLSNYQILDNVLITEDISKEYEGEIFSISEQSTKEQIILESDDKKIIINKPTANKTIKPNKVDKDSWKKSEGGENPNEVVQENENKQQSVSEFNNKFTGAKLISTDNDGKPFPFITEQFAEYLEWEKEPVNKKGTKVGFEINEGKFTNANWNNALKGLKKIQEGKTLTDKEINFLVDHLPINAVISSDVKAPIETRPNTKKEPVRFNNTSRILRQAIISELINGKSISDITTTIEGQYPGVLKVAEKVDNKVVENNVLDLHFLKGLSKEAKIKKIKDNIGVVNENGDIIFANGSTMPMKPKSKGEFYLKIPMSNGDIFPLKLNSKKISESHADILYDLYVERIKDKDLTKSTRLNDLNPELVSKVKKELQQEIEIIGTGADITIKDIIDFLIWDGGTSLKSRIGFKGTGQKGVRQFVYGNPGLDGAIVNEGKALDKESFKKWLINNKRYSISFDSSDGQESKASITINNNYIEYLLDNKLLNTNAVVGEMNPTFGGFSTIYLDVNGIKPVKNKESLVEKDKAKKVETLKKKSSPNDKIDIEENMLSELVALLITKKLIKGGNSLSKILKKGNKSAIEYLKSIAEKHNEDISSIIKKC